MSGKRGRFGRDEICILEALHAIIGPCPLVLMGSMLCSLPCMFPAGKECRSAACCTAVARSAACELAPSPYY